MDSGLSRRRTVALIAAYAVALQTLLAAFVPMAAMVPAGSLAVICSHDGGAASGQPGPSHDLPCAALCAAMAQALSGPLPPTVAVATVTLQVVSNLAPASDWVPPSIAFAHTHAPRGPPVA
jgi:hypothetical protein